MSHTVIVSAVKIGEQAVMLAAFWRPVRGKHTQRNTAWFMHSFGYLTSLFQHNKSLLCVAMMKESPGWQPRVVVLVSVNPLILCLSQVAGPIMLPGFTAPSVWQHSL